MKVGGTLLTVELLCTIETWILVWFGLVFPCKVDTAESQCLHIKLYELACKAAIWLFSNIK